MTGRSWPICILSHKDKLWYRTIISARYCKRRSNHYSNEDQPLRYSVKRIRKLFSLNQKMTLVQNGAPAHTTKSTQNWCKPNLPILSKNLVGPLIPQMLALLKICGELWMRIHTEIRNRKPWHSLRGAFPKHGLISPWQHYRSCHTPCHDAYKKLSEIKEGMQDTEIPHKNCKKQTMKQFSFCSK